MLECRGQQGFALDRGHVFIAHFGQEIFLLSGDGVAYLVQLAPQLDYFRVGRAELRGRLRILSLELGLLHPQFL